MNLDNKKIISIAVLAAAIVSAISIVALQEDISEIFTASEIKDTGKETISISNTMSDKIEPSESQQDQDLHYLTVENLIGNLIEKYDDTGLDEMRNANFVAHLTGNSNGTRYLYIVDPEVGVVGKPDESLGLKVSIPPLEDEDAMWIGYVDRFPAGELEDIKIQRYFKMHDGLIFTSGFGVDSNGLAK